MTDVKAGRVISAANLAGWTDVPLRDLLQARFRAEVQVDNDANMAALGERWRGRRAPVEPTSCFSRSAPASAPASSSAAGCTAAITGTRGKSAG